MAFDSDPSVPRAASEALSRLSTGPLSQAPRTFTLGLIEEILLRDYPLCDAEEWDRMGLLVGDPEEELSRVAVALDPTVPAIEAAAAAGANLLLTHHPAFLEPPAHFGPARSPLVNSGAVVYKAIASGVGLMNVHTALDCSHAAAKVLPGLLGLVFTGQLACPLPHDKTKGYGQLCQLSEDDHGLSLEQLAARCLSIFGRPPRVWGDPGRPINRVITMTGSANGTIATCLGLGADCVVCGELSYHKALDASLAGLSVIELGHDASELPLVAVLVQSLLRAAVPPEMMLAVDESRRWTTPEAVRL